MNQIYRPLSVFSLTALVFATTPSFVQAQSSTPATSTTQTSSERELLEQGIDRIEQGNYQEAINIFTEVIEQHPREPAPYINRGIAHQKLGNYEDAIEDYQQALQYDPENGLAYLNWGIVHYEQQDYEEAAKKIDRATALLKKHLKAANIQNDVEKINSLKSQLVEAYNNKGNIKLLQESFQEALDAYQTVLTYDEDNWRAHLNIGNTYHRMRYYEYALRKYNQVIRNNSEIIRAYDNRGRTYLALSSPEEALQDFNKAIELDPQNASYFYYRGIAYQELNDLEAAKEDFNKAMRLYQQNNNIEGVQKSEQRLQKLQQ